MCDYCHRNASYHPKSFFLFLVFCLKKISSYTFKVMMKKVADRGFLAFWPFENERKLRGKCKNVTKSLKFDKKWVSTTFGTSTEPWNVRMYHHHHHHHANYYADHRFPFPVINTNPFVIHCCEFHLFLSRTVLIICFMTNLSPMRKLSLFRTLQNYNFIASTIASVKRHRVW